MRRRKALLIDANPVYERKNEGKLIHEFLNIIGVESDYRRVKNKSELLRLLAKSGHGLIHISAHGKRDGIQIGSGKVTSADILSIGEERKSNRLRKALLVICSACHGGSEEIAMAFVKALCNLYLGPKRETYWIDTAFLSIHFYHSYYQRELTLNGSVDSAFRKRDYTGVWYTYP